MKSARNLVWGVLSAILVCTLNSTQTFADELTRVEQKQRVTVNFPNNGIKLWSAEIPTKLSVSAEASSAILEIPFEADTVADQIDLEVYVEVWNEQGKKILDNRVSEWNPISKVTLEELPLYRFKGQFAGNNTLLLKTCYTVTRALCLVEQTKLSLQISEYVPLQEVALNCKSDADGYRYYWSNSNKNSNLNKIEIGISTLRNPDSDPKTGANYTEYVIWDRVEPTISSIVIPAEDLLDWVSSENIDITSTVRVAVRAVDTWGPADWGSFCYVSIEDFRAYLVPNSPKITKASLSKKELKLAIEASFEDSTVSFELGLANIKKKSLDPRKYNSFYPAVKVKDFDNALSQKVSNPEICREVRKLTRGDRSTFLVYVRAVNEFGKSAWSNGYVFSYKNYC